MNAQAILSSSDRDLFPEVSGIKTRFHNLAKLWHPDTNHDPDAKSVFDHIMRMRDKALNRGKLPNEVFTRIDGTSFRMEFLRVSTGQGFRVFTGKTRVAYHVVAPNVDLGKRASRLRWKFASPNMKAEMSRFLPELARCEELDAGYLLIYPRNEDQILMSDLIALETEIAPASVTWMISRMLNIACYLEYAKIAHCGISPEMLLVSLDQHSVALVGPALYSTTFGTRPTAVPKRTLDVANWLTKRDEVADSRIDLALVRQTALDLLQDRGGARLRANPKMRTQITDWILSPSAKSALSDYENWETARGERLFAQYGKTAKSIYDSAA